MKKKILIAMLVMMCCTACGTEQERKSSDNEDAFVAETELTEAENDSAYEEEIDVELSEEPTEDSVVEYVEFTLADGLSENYADLENRSFAYNGKVFTLGKSTLKDLIDGGVPFKESELNNKGNNVNSNYETGTYTVKINDHVSIQLNFINITEDNLTEEECLLSTLRWYSIYVPEPDYDESFNNEIINNINEAAGTLCFSFPLNLTKEQLIENNPDGVENNDHVEYELESEVYMGTSGYDFEFNSKTNQLKEVYITWLP